MRHWLIDKGYESSPFINAPIDNASPIKKKEANGNYETVSCPARSAHGKIRGGKEIRHRNESNYGVIFRGTKEQVLHRGITSARECRGIGKRSKMSIARVRYWAGVY